MDQPAPSKSDPQGPHATVRVGTSRLTTPLPMPISVRGWLRGKPSSQDCLRDAALPAGIERVIAAIISRARLWRSEERDVARELCAHFSDGLDSGRTPEELLAAFGDPAGAGRLIGRAKRQSRPLWWRTQRWALRGVGVSCLLLLALYAVLALMFFARRPTISRHYIAEMNQRITAAPEQQRAWPLYMQALREIPRVPEELAGNATDSQGNIITARNGDTIDTWPQKPGDPRWPEAKAWVTDHQKAIETIRRGAALPHLGFVLGSERTPEYEEILRLKSPDGRNGPETAYPIDPDPPLINVLLPYLSDLRHFGRTLVVDARVAIESHDADRFVANIRAIAGIARHADEPDLLINKLVQVALFTLACNTVKEALPSGVLAETHLRDLAHTLATFDESVLRIDFSTERLFLDDFVQRSYSDNGRGSGHLTYEGLRFLSDVQGGSAPQSGDSDRAAKGIEAAIGPASILVMASRHDLMRKADDIYTLAREYAQTPMWLREGSAAEREAEALNSSFLQRTRYSLLAIVLPATTKATSAIDHARQVRDGTLVAIALESYRLRHGAYPAALSDLVPAFLPAVPVDRFDGSPMKYRLAGSDSDARPILYSIGVDRFDDHGRGPADPRSDASVAAFRDPAATVAMLAQPSTAPTLRGDWILYDPGLAAGRLDGPVATPAQQKSPGLLGRPK